MSDRPICAVEGCEAPKWARGWCNLHYGRWRATGDPGPAERRRYGTQACEVDGCDRPHFIKGMCRPHSRAMETHGTVTSRRRAEVVDGKRICPRCGVDKPLSEWGQARCCKACNRANARKYMQPAATADAQCQVCGGTYAATKRQRATCSPECRAIHQRNLDAISRHARRARLRDAETEVFTPLEIFERDRWTCGLCAEPIDPTLRWPDTGSVSLDHIVPLARGGGHTRANCQAAHLGCNAAKGARVTEEVA